MPFNTPEKLSAYLQSPSRRASALKTQAEYRKKNPELVRRTKQKSAWKCKGVRNVNDEMYYEWLNTEKCNICNIILTDEARTTATRRCLEHDHISKYKRFICCASCNNKVMDSDILHSILMLELHRYFNLN